MYEFAARVSRIREFMAISRAGREKERKRREITWQLTLSLAALSTIFRAGRETFLSEMRV